jgi:general L-amino acid transport system substrate-binding protein
MISERYKFLAFVSALILFALSGLLAAGASASTVESIKERGHLNCGVSEGLVGFSSQDENKVWSGFDVDFCRAVAAAIFGSGDKVEFVPLLATERFDALKAGKIDLLSRNTTWTLERDMLMGFDFAGVIFYDGQGFMTRIENGLTSTLQLASARICLLKGTTSSDNAENYFLRHGLTVTFLEFDRRSDALKAYTDRKCDAYSADKSALASERTKLDDSEAHVLLPEVISKEPLGPVVRKDDAVWTGLVRWVLFLLINAEELNWSQATAAQRPAEAGILSSPELIKTLGVSGDWDRKVIAAVGHYGELFERNVGKASPLQIGRGLNAPWTNGGILYAPPLR